MVNRNPLVITISGVAGAGKTALMKQLAVFLTVAGADVTVREGSEPPMDFDDSPLATCSSHNVIWEERKPILIQTEQ